MTTKNQPTRHARKVSLTRRVLSAQADLTAAEGARQEMAFGAWLRRMAACRQAVAELYRAASREYAPDSIEWHALVDASIMLDLHAASNISHANAYAEPEAQPEMSTGPVLVGGGDK